MKSSQYNLFISLKENLCAVYNTLSRSVLLVDDELKRLLEDNNISSATLDEATLKTLRDTGAIVDDKLDELRVFKLRHNLEQYSANYSSYIIFPTSHCNLRCTYCYQRAGGLACETMNDQVVESVISFIKKQTLENKSRFLLVKLFGGEPLLNPKLCLRICTEIHEWSKQNGIEYYGALTTNATLLKGETLEALAPHIMAVHVTLDGSKETHDKKRVYPDGRGTYEEIMESLEQLKKTPSIRVALRVNMHDEKLEDLRALLEDLRQRGLDENPNIDIEFGLVVTEHSCGHEFVEEDYVQGKQWIVDLSPKLDSMTKETGWEKHARIKHADDILAEKRYVPCQQTSARHYVIDATGAIYLCPSRAGNSTFKVGSIHDGGIVKWEPTYYEIIARDPLDYEKCRSCVYLPLCAGGCAVHAYESNGEFNSSFCGAAKQVTAQRVASYLQRTLSTEL